MRGRERLQGNFQPEGTLDLFLLSQEPAQDGTTSERGSSFSGAQTPFTSKLTCAAASVQRPCWDVCFSPADRHPVGWRSWLVMHRCLGPSPSFLKSFPTWFMATLCETATTIISVILRFSFFLVLLSSRHVYYQQTTEWLHSPLSNSPL